MNPRIVLATFVAATMTIGCTVMEEPFGQEEGPRITVTASLEGPGTKTTVQDGGTQVYWEPGDEIKVFFKNSSGRFVSQNETRSEIADFTGSLNIVVGSNEGASTSHLTWGLYPFRSDATCDGESVTTTLPAEQVGRAGSFAKDTHITLACSDNYNLAFYNVCGGLRFSLLQEGIKSVVFSGNGKEAVAGRITLGFEDGEPVIKEVTEWKDEITLTAPDGGTFETGKWYYIEALPGTLFKGFTMRFNKARGTAELVSAKSVVIKRGKFGSLAEVDKSLTFTGGYPEPEAVDLGLPSGLKWASFNVCAASPEDIGGRYAWGELESKTYYDWDNYKWCNGTYNSLTKYCTNSSYGSVDGLTRLEKEDDVAYMMYGDRWRMPDNAELDELARKCTWTYASVNGIAGYNVKGPNGNSIFIPGCGSADENGFHYSSEVLLWSAETEGSYYGTLLSSNVGYVSARLHKHDGICVRAVYCEEPVDESKQYVDLGLSVKWATCNVGATKPEEYGDYFAWGETEPKGDHGWSTYKWCKGSYNTLTKYNTDLSYGTVDYKSVLELEDDAARANWGGSWRMPTDAEWTELREICTWTWTTKNGVNGRLVTSKTNGNSIFLPAAGFRNDYNLYYAGSFGNYWSSSLYTDDLGNAWDVTFSSGGIDRDDGNRYSGLSVRPVLSPKVSGISFDKTELNLLEGESAVVTATVYPSTADNKNVTWFSNNTAVAMVDSDGVVTGVKEGTAVITVTTVDGGYQASCTVTVESMSDELPQVKTIVYNATGQPPIAGGHIFNYSPFTVLRKGIVVGTDKNSLIIDEDTEYYSPGFGHCLDGSVSDLPSLLFPKDFLVLDCTDDSMEQFGCPVRLLKGNTTYYIRSFVQTIIGESIYGNIEEIRTSNFRRSNSRADIANVWDSGYSVFDLMTDELIDWRQGYYA